MTLKGFSNSPKKLVDVVCNDKAYNYSTPTGGKSSTSRSIQLTIPETFESFKVYAVATTNNSAVSKMAVGLTAEYNTTDNLILTTGDDIDTYTFGYSESMTPGTYFVTFDNSVRIAELSVVVNIAETITEEPDADTSNSVEMPDDDLLIGNKVTPLTRAKKIRLIVGTLFVAVLVVIILILILNITKKYRNKAGYDDFYDIYDDDYFDEF